MRLDGETVWLTQQHMAKLLQTTKQNVGPEKPLRRGRKVFDDAELEAGSVIRNFRITAADGKTYDTQHYNRSAII